MTKSDQKITSSFLDDLEKMIRDNQAPKLSYLTREINPKKIPLNLVSRYANLLRRMGAIKYATKILNPLIRNPHSHPSNDMLIEYASCLTRLHLCEESIEILESLDDKNNFEVDFELAAAHVAQWDYEKAIPHLTKYLKNHSLPKYRIFVGQLNLGAALIYVGKMKNAESLLLKIYREAKKEDFHLLAGNACDLLSEVAITRRNFKEAANYIKMAKDILRMSSSRYNLFVERRELSLKLMTKGRSAHTLADFHRLRKKAVELKEWNTVRELEIFRAIGSNDLDQILFVYYSTGYPLLRKRIQNLWRKPIPSLEFYDRKIGPKPHKKFNVFDISMGRDLATGASLKPGQSLHRLIYALSTEVYSPYSVSKIFSLVFQGLKYNPQTSILQVYSVINRLNAWFIENKVPLCVIASSNGYRLRSNEGYTLRIKTTKTLVNKIEDFIVRLIESGIDNGFNVKAVEDSLKIPRRTAVRLLSESVHAGRLRREGHTNLTKYFFVSK